MRIVLPIALLLALSGCATTPPPAQEAGVDLPPDAVAAERTMDNGDVITEYRNAIINVDMEIIHSLEPCFMQVWGSYDTIFSNCHNYGE